MLGFGDARIVYCPSTGTLDGEDNFPVGYFSRESSLNQREKYLAEAIIKAGQWSVAAGGKPENLFL